MTRLKSGCENDKPCFPAFFIYPLKRFQKRAFLALALACLFCSCLDAGALHGPSPAGSVHRVAG